MQVVLIILATLGVALLFLFLAIVAVLWWLKRKIARGLKGFVDAIGTFGNLVPPFTVELEPSADHTWSDAEKIGNEVRALCAAGFAKAGVWTIAPPVNVAMTGLVNSSTATMAIVYEHPSEGIWVDLQQNHEDGTSFGVTSARETGMARSPDHVMTAHTGLPAAELLAVFRESAPAKPRKPIEVSAFKATFEADYAAGMDWHLKRGGPTEAEIRRIAELGGNEVDEEQILLIQTTWRQAIEERFEVLLRAAFLNLEAVTASEWDRIRERIIFVSDYTSLDRVIDWYRVALGWDMGLFALEEREDDASFSTEDQAKLIELREAYEQAVETAEQQIKDYQPRAAFTTLNEQLTEENRYRQLCHLTDPTPAEVYVPPDWDDV